MPEFKVIKTPPPKSSAEIMEFVRELMITCAIEHVTGIAIVLVKDETLEVSAEYDESCDPDDMLDGVDMLKLHIYDLIESEDDVWGDGE
jgi:hypothetical protein